MKSRDLVAFAVLCLVSAAIGFGAYGWLTAARPDTVVERRPDLEFRDLDGRARRLSEWDGKLVLLNFWATWCTPCLKEIPLLVDAQQQHAARGLQIVGVAMDEIEPVRRFAERLHINYPLMIGAAEVAAAMDQLGDTLGAFPFSVLISPDGRILERASGDLSREELRAWFDEHLPR